MKSYKVYYNKATGLRQIGTITAICYIFQDGFIHFYDNEDSFQKGHPYKSINKDAIDCIEQINQSVV